MLLTGGVNGSLKLWQIPSSNMRRSHLKHGVLVWSINPLNEKITDIIHLASNSKRNEREYNGLVMLSTASGSFALFDINKSVRKSFSSSKTPQQVMIWNISHYRGLKMHLPPGNPQIEIKKCLIQNSRENVLNANCLQKFVDLSICLSIGWVIRMHLDLLMVDGCWQVSGPNLKVQHKPPNMIYHDSERNVIEKQNPLVCMPEVPTAVACSTERSPVILITDVRPTDTMLPDVDKRVLGRSHGTPMAKRGNSDHILVLNQSSNSRPDDTNNILSQISLPRGKLRQMAVHPDNQWIVLSLSNRHPATPDSLLLMDLHVQATAY